MVRSFDRTRRTTRFPLSIFVLLASCAFAQSPVEFSAPVIQTGASINSFTLADVGGSPHPEFIYQAFAGGAVIMDRHTSGAPQITNLGGTSGNVRSWAVGDVNLDGQKDIITLATGVSITSSAVNIFASTGAGYALTTISDPSVTGMTVHVVDVDGDGALDLVYGSQIRFNVGGAFPNAVAIPVSTAPRDVQPGDFDGDGDIDLAYLSVASGSVTIQCLRNDGGQTFTPRTPSTVSGDYFIAKVAKMNGDARDDLVLLYSAADRVRFRTLLGTTQATFSAQAFFEIYGNVESTKDLGLADLDGDGATDAVGTFLKPDFSSATVIMMNVGTGTFVPGVGLGIGLSLSSGISRFKLIDEDLDGDVDIVGGSSNGFLPFSQLSTAFNIPATPLGPTAISPSTPNPPVTAILGSTFFAGYQLQLGNGLPAKSRIAKITFTSSIGSTPNPVNAVTDSSGHLEFEIDFGNVPGVVGWTVTTSDGGLVAQSVISPPTLSVVSGNGQMLCAGNTSIQPLVARVLDATGAPVAGLPVTFDSNFMAPTMRITDAQGDATLLSLPQMPPSPGQWLITASVPGATAAVFSLTILPPLTAMVGGSNQSIRAGDAFPNPLTMIVGPCGGPPAVGVVVSFATSNTAVSLSAASAVTDAGGFVSVNAFANPSGLGACTVTATVNGSQVGTLNLFVRKLRALSTVSTVIFLYNHEHPNVPLLLAADLPLPAPGSIATPLGDIHTSILNPSPSLVVLDGLGFFGPIDPQMTTLANGAWTRSIARPAVPLGITMVLELYGYDAAYPGIDAYFLSNPINVSI